MNNKYLMRSSDSAYYKLTEERESELVEIINANRDLFSKSINSLSKEDRKKRKKADRAVNELISAYAPFIEKLVSERIKDAGSYIYTKEDYISEAYLTAIQNARAFNPKKSSSGSMRFSSYCSRPISSVISRMVAKSRSELNVPSAKMQDARRWSHTLFELSDSDRSVSDEMISEISGVKSNQFDIRAILNSTTHEDLNEEISADSSGIPGDANEDSLIRARAIEKAMVEVFGEKEAKQYLIATGLVIYENIDNKDIIIWNEEDVRRPNGSTQKLNELRDKLSKKATFNKLQKKISENIRKID